MKTAYELAMERLGRTSPGIRLSAEQKKALAELDTMYRAKLAEREIALDAELSTAAANGDMEKVEKLREQLTDERKKLQAELEEKKERIRQEAKGPDSK